MNMADLTLSEASFGPGLLKSDSDADVFDDTKLQSTSSLQLNINHSQRIVDYNETRVSGAQDEDGTPTRTKLAQQRTIPPIREIINAGLTAHSAQLEASSQVKPQIETVNAWIPIKLEQKHEFLTDHTLITSAGLWNDETITSGLNERQSLEVLEPQSLRSSQNIEESSSQILVSESHCASDVIVTDPITQPGGTSAQPAHPVKTVPSAQSEIKLSKSLFETYHGFIEDPVDAVYVVQGTLKGVLPAFRGNSDDMASVKVRSGTVIVMPEKGLSVKRWRDGIKWSPSRAYGNFLLYRQIESETKNTNEPDDDDDTNPRPYSAPYGSTTGLQPTFTSKTLKEGTRIAKNGLTKRTITVKGSDGEKHRVISYYNSRDVMAMMRAAQRGEGGESLSARLLRASEDENLIDAVKLSSVDAIELVKQMYPAFEVIVRQEVVKESPSKKLKLEGSVKLEDTIGPITAFTDPGRRTSKSLLHLYERDFVGYHPYRAGSLLYDEFKATLNPYIWQFGKEQHMRYEYAGAVYQSQSISQAHGADGYGYDEQQHQPESHQQQHPLHRQPQQLNYAFEALRLQQHGFRQAQYSNYQWSYDGYQ